MKALWDGVYSFVSARTSTPVYAGVATDQEAFPYIVYNVTQLEPFDYVSKDKGWDLYSIEFDVVSTSMSDVGDLLQDLWDMFESGSPTVSEYTYGASYRDEVTIELEPSQEQDGNHVWFGRLVVESWLWSSGDVFYSSSSSASSSSSSP